MVNYRTMAACRESRHVSGRLRRAEVVSEWTLDVGGVKRHGDTGDIVEKIVAH